ncbi:MAG TPA: transcription elongation factor GreA [Dehalococcoidales bacterium]|nr:transcription elongation factor GreA [Dehalococcoidales bacterium]
MADVEELTLEEAVGRYIATLAEEKKPEFRQEIRNFVRQFGSERLIGQIKGFEVSNYTERLAQNDRDFGNKIEPVRAFLTYVKKQKWNAENLAAAIKVKKVKIKTVGPTQKMNRDPIPLTREKFEEMTAELATLRAKRVEVIADIQRAAADKDLKENAPYHAAREQKGLIEGRIIELDETLACAVITDSSGNNTRFICVGDNVVIEAVESKQELRFKLVNPKEVAPSKSMISVVSPVGKAVLGKAEGDEVTVTVPSGKMIYRVKKVEK